MAHITIDENLCTACESCVEECPVGVLVLTNGKIIASKEEECMGCGFCETVCPTGAIKIEL